MNFIKFVVFSVAIMFSLFSCRQKLDDKDFPDVDQVMLNSAGPKLDKLNEDIEKDPENPLNFYKRAKIYYELLDFEKALNDINKAIQIDNRQGKFYYLLGRIYQVLDKKTLALKAAERSVELGNKEAGVLTLLAELYQETGNNEQADKYLIQATNVAPHHPEVIYLQANQKLRRGDTTGALAGYKTSIIRDPKFAKSYVGAAEIYEAKRKNDSALVFIIQGLRFSNEKAPLYYLNGKIMERIGMKESGYLSYESAASIDSSFYPVYLKLGDYHYEKGDSVKSIAYYSHFVKNDLSKNEVNLRLARLYQRTNQGQKAIPVYEHILASDTSNTEAKEALKGLYAVYGEKTKPAVKPDTVVKKDTSKVVAPIVPPTIPDKPVKESEKKENKTTNKPSDKKPAKKEPESIQAPAKKEEPAPTPQPAPQENEGSNKVQLEQKPIIETAPPATENGADDSREERKRKKKNKQKE